MIEKEPSPYLHSPAKRTLDIAIASGGLGLTCPIWPLVYGINRSHQISTLYQFQRVGLHKTEFMMRKFETMGTGAEQSQLAQSQVLLGGQEREDDDPRVIPIYKKICFRSTGINEIPQMLNVLAGEMSIVGPRPYPKDDLQKLKDMFPKEFPQWESVVFFARPGFSANPRVQRALGDNDFPKKAEIDMEYVYNASLWRDLTIIADTVHFMGQTAFRTLARYLSIQTCPFRSKITNK